MNLAHVRVRLRKVPEQASRFGIDVLREEALLRRELRDVVEHLHRVVESARHGERFGPPEGANRERAVRFAEVVDVAIAKDETAVDELLRVRVERREEAWIGRGDEAQRGEEQVRSIRVLAIE